MDALTSTDELAAVAAEDGARANAVFWELNTLSEAIERVGSVVNGINTLARRVKIGGEPAQQKERCASSVEKVLERYLNFTTHSKNASVIAGVRVPLLEASDFLDDDGRVLLAAGRREVHPSLQNLLQTWKQFKKDLNTAYQAGQQGFAAAVATAAQSKSRQTTAHRQLVEAGAAASMQRAAAAAPS